MTEIIDGTGDGAGNTLSNSRGVAVDGAGFVYVGGRFSSNAFRVCAPVEASEVVRLGAPPNPAAFLPGVTSGPVIGSIWDPVIDHTSFLPGATIDFLAVGAVASDFPSPLGTVLVGISPLSVVTSSPGTPLAVPIPVNWDIVGVTLPTQGGSIGSGLEIVLANALDITIGTF
ncbi:hypothetical protein [Engelhardtia mirabilis]|uniref:hypothetical protein n=1 Tax=Engelhardtia mirabilis TaxID=2528011 RepID=UPI00119EFD61